MVSRSPHSCRVVVAVFMLTATHHPAFAQVQPQEANKRAAFIVRRIIDPLLPNLFDHADDLEAYLQARHVMEPPTKTYIGNDYSRLPAPPDSGLAYTLGSMTLPPLTPPNFYLEWLPSQKIGGVYGIEGSGVCLTWTMFESDGKTTSQIDTPDIFWQSTCTRDGAQSYFGVIDHQVVAIDITPFAASNGRTALNLRLQVWDGTEWSAPVSATGH